MLHLNTNKSKRVVSRRLITLIITASLFLSFPNVTKAVDQSKTLSKIIFNNYSISLFWGIGLINLIGNPLYYKLYKEKTLPDAPQVVYNFCRDIIKPPQNMHFYVKTKDSTQKQNGHIAADTLSIIMLVPKGGVDDIIKLHASLTCKHKDQLSVRCNCPESTAIQNELDAYRFIAHHEAIHAKEHHLAMFGLACLGVSTLTHVLSTLLRLNKHELVKSIVNLLLVSRFRRYIEERADAGIPDNKELLRSGIQFLTNAQAIMAKFRGTTNHSNFIGELFASHPSFSQRIDPLQKRIAAL